MEIRDRIKSLRRVPAGKLKTSPKNWREHGEAQRSALRGALAEIGFADAVLARQLEDGSLEIIDGHLRLEEVPPEMKVPTLVLDVTEDEAATLLATLDPIGALAETNQEALAELIEGCRPETPELESFLDKLAADNALELTPPAEQLAEPTKIYEVIVTCADRADQQAVYERLHEEDRSVRRATRKRRG